jgi:cell wall-associated NlpC family hydrolase
MSRKKHIMVLGFIILSMMISGGALTLQTDAASVDVTHYYGIVNEGPLNVRTGPSITDASLGKLSTGTKLTITDITTVNSVKWYRFSYQSKPGYVCGKYVTLTGSQVFYANAKTATVIQGPLNVRSGPSTGASIIGSATGMKTISTTGMYYKYGSAKWYKVTWNGHPGYLCAEYVAQNTAGSTIKKYSTTQQYTIKVSSVLKTGPGTSFGNGAQLSAGKLIGVNWEIINPAGEKWLLYKNAYAIYYIPAKNVAITTQTSTTNAQKIVSLAYSKLGCDYVYGTEGPSTFDCSGFVYWVVNHSGIAGLSVPRTSGELYSKYKANNIGTSISNAKPGDIILFSNNGAASGICHSAIYYKNSMMIHASSPDTGVILTTVSYSTSNKSVFAIIRLPGV